MLREQRKTEEAKRREINQGIAESKARIKKSEVEIDDIIAHTKQLRLSTTVGSYNYNLAREIGVRTDINEGLVTQIQQLVNLLLNNKDTGIVERLPAAVRDTAKLLITGTGSAILEQATELKDILLEALNDRPTAQDIGTILNGFLEGVKSKGLGYIESIRESRHRKSGKF